jgi:fructosamine-3-kinase
VTERLDTDAGAFVLKSNPTGPPDALAAEAAGLEALGTIGLSLVVPRVIACETGGSPFLRMECVEAGRPRPDCDDRLGRGLAELHRHSAARVGFARTTYCGTTPQLNSWTDTWIAFYSRARLGQQVALAARAGLVSAPEARRCDDLVDRLDRILTEPPEGPALIHGDLWSGNLLTSDDGRPVLIDPAVSFSHREAELGMMLLFGGFSPRVIAAYHEAFPLDPGWRERNPLYQLYHLLNHLNLFGRGYHGQVMTIVARYAARR